MFVLSLHPTSIDSESFKKHLDKKMTEASATTYEPTASNYTASTSTLIESSTTYHVDKSGRDLDDDDDDNDEDDDEKLFAELDKELDMMEDESNFGHHGGDTVASFDMAEFRERRMEELRQE